MSPSQNKEQSVDDQLSIQNKPIQNQETQFIQFIR